MDNESSYFQAKNGLRVEIRPVCDEDAPYLVDLFEHLSLQSRYQRFNRPVIDPAPEFVESSARDYAHIESPSEGLLAFVDLPGQPHAAVGGGRFIVFEPGVAEVSLAVRDDLHGQGIGTEILRRLIEDARKAGIKKLVASVQASNRAVIHLVKRGHFPISCVTRRGEMDIELDIAGAHLPD